MHLNTAVSSALEKYFTSGNYNIIPVQGGSINSAFRIEKEKENYFLKTNDAKLFPGMFEAETKGLRLLRKAFEQGVPEVTETGIAGEEQYLLMEYIPSAAPGIAACYNFGRALAKMHRNTTDYFGLDHDNYIGSLPQRNKTHHKWTDFFISERISPLIKTAIDSGAMMPDLTGGFNKLFSRIDELFPAEPPALLHGDLWSGNYKFGKGGEAWIFDPAVYFGHRETDIAMTKLFGGFAADFYSGYDEEYPLEKGWEKRMDIFNLYPLLVHVNLFGGHYIYDVERIVKRF